MLILKIIQSQKRPKKPWLCLNVSRPSEISIFLLFNVRLQSWGITTQEADFLSGFTEFRDIPDFTQVAEFYRISARSGCPEFREAQTFLESVPLVQVTSCFFCDLLHYTLKKVIARARVFSLYSLFKAVELPLCLRNPVFSLIWLNYKSICSDTKWHEFLCEDMDCREQKLLSPR